jgi:hypothetical protein
LFTSSPRSWQLPFEAGIIKRESLVFPKAGSPGRFALGVLLQGEFSDTFKGAKVPDWPDSPEKALGLTTKPKPGKLIVVGCAKMFSDQLITSPGNLGLFANIVDSFTLGDDLIQIRSKTLANRSIKKLTDSQKVWFRFIAVGLFPFAWIIYAYLRLLMRRKEKKLYLEQGKH